MTTKKDDVKQKTSTVTKFSKSLIIREIKIKARASSAAAIPICSRPTGLIPRAWSRVPLEPPVRAILATITILKGNRRSAAGEHRNFRQRGLAVIRVHEVEKGPVLQFLNGASQHALPCRVQPFEVSIMTGSAQQVERLGEETGIGNKWFEF
jgi:hypothetical protein